MLAPSNFNVNRNMLGAKLFLLQSKAESLCARFAEICAVLYLFGMKKKSAMTTGEFAKASGIPAYNVVRWCQRGLIPGVVREETMRGPVWVIPASALDSIEKWRPAIGRPLKPEAELSRPRKPKSEKNAVPRKRKG